MKVSFVVPVFNPGEFLQEAVNSIVNQEWSSHEYEILLVDDCSTEPLTLELLNAYSEQLGISVLRQPHNAGPAAARNAGMAAATGEWIAFLDADDYLVRGAMARRLAAIQTYPEMAWLAGNILVLSKRDEAPDLSEMFYDAGLAGSPQDEGIVVLRKPARTLLHWPFVIQVGSAMFKRDLLADGLQFDVSLHYGEDWYFWLLLAGQTDLWWIEEPLVCLRRHHESMMKNQLALAEKVGRASQKALGDVRLSSYRKDIRWKAASDQRWSSRLYRRQGHHLKAMLAAAGSLRFTPNSSASWKELYAGLQRRRD